MILLSIRLFLRGGECTGDIISDCPVFKKKIATATGLTMSSFMYDIISVTPSNELRSIAVTVKGKTNKKRATLVIHADRENPKLCPILHLLLYVYLIGIKGFHF